jgi:hypothetical protein
MLDQETGELIERRLARKRRSASVLRQLYRARRELGSRPPGTRAGSNVDSGEDKQWSPAIELRRQADRQVEPFTIELLDRSLGCGKHGTDSCP